MKQFQRWQRAARHRDWISTSVLTLLVAAAGAGVAVALTNEKSSESATVAVSTTVSTVPTTTVATTAAETSSPTTTVRPTPTTTTAPRTTTAIPATTPAQPSGQVVWPRNRSGWSLFLATYPAAGGRAAALASAERAARSGLPQVGVLDSSEFASLRPGYYVVFSGMYQSQSEAQSARARAQAGGFGNAYPRNISP
jgi:cytoskeletal protein RodZ